MSYDCDNIWDKVCAYKEAEMIFEFPAYEIGPMAIGDIWMLLRSLGVECTSTLKISETKDGVVTLELDLSSRMELLAEVEPLLVHLGGRRLDEQKGVENGD